MAASGRSNGHDLGPEAFVHLDVVSAFSRMQSPSAPRDYVSAFAQQFPLNERTAGDSRPALAICDWGLRSSARPPTRCSSHRCPHPGVVRADPHAAELIATPDPSTAIVDTETLPIAEALTHAESHHPPEEHEDSPLRNPPHLYLVNTNPTPEVPAPAHYRRASIDAARRAIPATRLG
jgi:hypothetical protein